MPVLCLGIVLAGCAPGPRPEHRPLHHDVAVSDPAAAPGDLPRPALTHTLATGYEAIADRFIRATDAGEVALNGLKGLGALDPALVAERIDRRLIIRRGDTPVTLLAVPADHDVGAWARLSVEAVAASRAVSETAAGADSERIYEALFDSALAQLDVHSRYAGAEQARARRAKREGFGGIGIRFRLAGPQVRITDVLASTPASAAGLAAGDLLVAVDGRTISGLALAEIRSRLRGPINSRLSLRIQKLDSTRQMDVDLVRRRIIPPSVFPGVTEDGIVTLRIASFNHDTARSLARRIAEEKRSLGSGLKGIVLDLRGNPGGLLRQAVEVADLFLDRGNIVRTHGRHPDSHQSYEAVQGDVAEGLPLAVVIDGRSASAAEIVAAALQDHGRAAVIGTTSYGKGTVQTVIRLPNDGEMTLTWSRFLAPSGYALHHLGVRPVFCAGAAEVTSAPDRSTLWRHALAQRHDIPAWRHVGIEASRERASLRAHCRPQRRRGEDDLVLARRVLADDALYALATALPDGATVAESEDDADDNRP